VYILNIKYQYQFNTPHTHFCSKCFNDYWTSLYTWRTDCTKLKENLSAHLAYKKNVKYGLESFGNTGSMIPCIHMLFPPNFSIILLSYIISRHVDIYNFITIIFTFLSLFLDIIRSFEIESLHMLAVAYNCTVVGENLAKGGVW
jgi:hypothetical protein